MSKTLRGLFDKGGDDFRLSLREVRIFRTTSTPWEEIPLEELPPPAESAAEAYVIAARRYCRAWPDEPVLVSANEWYIFREKRLTAYDSRSYRKRCDFVPALEPAQGESIETETHIREWLVENFPEAREPRVVLYAKGIIYAEADRLDVAEQYLMSGDAIPPDDADAAATTMLPGRSLRSGPERLRREVDEDAAREILAGKIEELHPNLVPR